MISLIYFSLIMAVSCGQNKSGNTTTRQNDTLKNSVTDLKGFQIWQLDYYPDSILINRSINDNSGWESAYAYNIQFSVDSCQFIGWHESWWNHLIKISDKEFKTKDDTTQYWELRFVSNEKLLMRQIFVRESKTEYGDFLPYHKVDKILTLDYLDYKIAKDIFAGTYSILFNDTFECEKTVVLDSDFGVKGIKGIDNYNFETAIDWDFPVFNAFGFTKKGDQVNMGLSFKFSGDTLLIMDYKLIYDNGDFDHVEISKTRMKMLKK